jgi:RHS repeat-associated protein
MMLYLHVEKTSLANFDWPLSRHPRITHIQPTTSRTETYAYDALSRLTSVSYGDGESQAYSFDSMGNRTSKTDSGGTGSGATYTFDAANRLTSVTPTGGATAAVTFDADGNTLTDASGRSYTWDSENRMTSCTYNGDTTTYTYGYDGLRRSSTKDSVTTNYVYDGTNLVAEMRPNASGTLVIVTSYLLGAQGIEAKIDETAQTEAYYKIDPTTGIRLFDANNNLIVAYRGVTSWYVYDGHGNVVGTVNGVTGAFAANPTLDVYGVPRASGTSATKQGYCGSVGHVTDDTGLVYMRARYYDPSVGRFVSEDPSANGNNWYVYASDNPVNMADSDGKIPYLLEVLGILIITLAAISFGIGIIGLCALIGWGLLAAVLTGYGLWEDYGEGAKGANRDKNLKQKNEYDDPGFSPINGDDKDRRDDQSFLGKAMFNIAMNMVATEIACDLVDAD